MLKNIKKVGEVLTTSTQKSILGGNACITCYDSCVLTSRDRVELGDCFDYCQQYVC